jgi:hypothetical protein
LYIEDGGENTPIWTVVNRGNLSRAEVNQILTKSRITHALETPRRAGATQAKF